MQIFYFVFRYIIIHSLCHLLIHKHLCPNGVAMEVKHIKTSKRRRWSSSSGWKIFFFISFDERLFVPNPTSFVPKCVQACFQAVRVYLLRLVCFSLTSYKECEQCGDASSILCRPNQAVKVDPFCKYHTVAFYVYSNITYTTLTRTFCKIV